MAGRSAVRLARLVRDQEVGGSNPLAPTIKKCSIKHEKLDFLKPIHEDAHLKNLRKIKKQGINKFISGKRYW